MLPETIEENLRRYGWAFERVHDSDTAAWQTGFHGERGAYPMRIRLTATFVCFEVSPLIAWPLAWHEWPDLLLAILEMNDGMKLAKIAVKPCGTLAISTQVPTFGLTYEAMETSLSVLGYYVDESARRLTAIMRELGCCRDGAFLL